MVGPCMKRERQPLPVGTANIVGEEKETANETRSIFHSLFVGTYPVSIAYEDVLETNPDSDVAPISI